MSGIVILPNSEAARRQTVERIETSLARIGCDPGKVDQYWTPESDDALKRLAEVRPDLAGAQLSITLADFLERLPAGLCRPVCAADQWMAPSGACRPLSICYSAGDGPVCDEPGTPAEETALRIALQGELNRLGCGAGTPDGVWGRRSDAALGRLAEQRPVVRGAEPSFALLMALKDMPDATCPAAAAPARNRNCKSYNGREYCE